MWQGILKIMQEHMKALYVIHRLHKKTTDKNNHYRRKGIVWATHLGTQNQFCTEFIIMACIIFKAQLNILSHWVFITRLRLYSLSPLLHAHFRNGDYIDWKQIHLWPSWSHDMVPFQNVALWSTKARHYLFCTWSTIMKCYFYYLERVSTP
jgi:hypothetical protein